ncbi:MAG: Sialic acid TRAP transporter permease protein SiaT [Syntrophorhabdaceae bacterium PtaU1.Bin034]|nr:MAG: Sialic acid TRAP transporter permease protein SiaT [Syntrophorhabdaceae bacterium PtaU1.Bin034]
MNEYVLGVGACIFLMLFFVTGIEIAFGIVVVGILGYIITNGPDTAFNLMAQDFFDTLSSYSLTVVPLFMLMGQIAFHAGIAQRLYDATYKLVGRVPGGLAMATVVAATAFKAMCGSTLATAATFSSVAVPQMTRYGYGRKLSTGVVASVGTLGILIPPSITMIIYGIMTEQSIGRLFLAGLVPGLLISFFFVGIIYVWCKIDPKLGPASTEIIPRKEKIRSLPEFVSVVLIFGIVIGGLLAGIFTPTEAGTIGTIAVFLLALWKKGLTFKVFVKSVDESMRGAVMVLILIACSAVLGHFLAITQIPQVAGDWLTSLPIHRVLVMVIIFLFYLLGGSFIDDLAFMILVTPILFPAVVKLGYDPMWFGVMVGVTLMVGTIIPPVAISVFVVKNITGESFKSIYAGVVPFLASFIVVGALLFTFPQIATFLPELLMGK